MINVYKNYTGYIWEVFTYFTYPFRSKAKPTTKFVIFTVGRSGSGLLVALLQSHQHIHCDDELFKKKVFSPLNYLQAKARLSSQDIYGFKLNTYQFRVQNIGDPTAFVGEIHRMGYRIIGLRRRNLLRQVISHMYAIHRNVYHQHNSRKTQPPAQSFIINLDELQEELSLFESYRTLRSHILDAFPHFELCYEDDLLNSTRHQKTIDNISKFLGVPRSRVQAPLTKTTPKQLSSFIVNFDEVEKFLLDTKYAKYLKME